jgi:neutral ceramidase
LAFFAPLRELSRKGAKNAKTEVIMKCGASQVTITPPVGVDLAGFGARQGPSVGVHDDLYVRGLYLESGGERLVWLHADLIGFSRETTAEVRAALAAEFGLAARQVMLSATHTHSGPATVLLRWCGSMDPDYMAALPGHLVDAARKAVAAAEEVSLRVGEGRCTLGQDRRPPGPLSHADSALPVIGFQRPDGTFVALLSNYAMHNVSLSSQNCHISGDVSGAAARHASNLLPGHPICLLTQGGCGNVNPPAESPCYEVMQQFGWRLGRQAAYAMQAQAAATEDARLAAALDTLDLPLDVLTPEAVEAEYVREMAALQPASAFYDHATRAYADWRAETLALLAAGTAPATVPLDVQTVRIGPVAFVAVAAEVFSRLAVDLRAALGPRVYVVGYANGDIGYLPPQEIYAEGGYEVDNAYKFYGHFMVAAGGFERVRERALALLAA